jgi:hypothetical protein
MSQPNIETSANPGSVLVGGTNSQPAVVQAYTTVNAPIATVGGIYWDSTLGNLMVGNAAGAWTAVITAA